MLFIGGLIKTGLGLILKTGRKIIKKKPRRPPPRPPTRAPSRLPPPPPRAPVPRPRIPPVVRRIPGAIGAGATGAAIARSFGGDQVGAGVDRLGRPLLVEATSTERIQCPTGYVAITLPDGSRACALKGVARAAGLWRPRPKPPIKASDWRKLKTAARVRKKAKKIGQTAGFKCTPKKGGF